MTLPIIIAGVATSILLSLVISLVYAKKRRSRKKPKKYDNETNQLNEKDNVVTIELINDHSIDMIISRQAELNEALLKRNCTVSLEEKLGEGNFGIVYQATMKRGRKTSKVAIKHVKNVTNQVHIDTLKSEIELMSTLKSKPNQFLVTLIEHVEKEGEAMWMIMEYCNQGELKKYLRNNKIMLLLEANVGVINSKSLCIWANHVSKGMAYLEECDIMHGDLAARNVLLSSPNNEHPIAKITDFGLSKNFCEYPDYQEISKSTPIPWRWMAYEVIVDDEKLCSLKSDVWSFGVLLWEIFSLGKRPYPEFNKPDKEFLDALENGKFLTFPKELKDIKTWSPESVFADVSKLCFQIDSSKRGSFCEITKIIQNSLMFMDENSYIDEEFY